MAKDASADFTTLQAAIDAATADPGPTTIRVGRGTYREVVTVAPAAPPIALVGATGHARDVVLTYDNASRTVGAGGTPLGTSGSASLTVLADRFSARDLTIENAYVRDADPGVRDQQAVALKTEADRLEFRGVRLVGRQDTLYVNAPPGRVARAYFRDCHIEGDIDFIFGSATAVFDRCVIRARDRGSTTNNGYVTAASTADAQHHGFLIASCRIESDAPPRTVYLGRPWQPGGDPRAIAQVVVRETWLAAAIRDDPWTDMHSFSWREARFFEYRNSGPGAAPSSAASPSARPQLSDAEASAFTARTYLAGADGWDPTV